MKDFFNMCEQVWILKDENDSIQFRLRSWVSGRRYLVFSISSSGSFMYFWGSLTGLKTEDEDDEEIFEKLLKYNNLTIRHFHDEKSDCYHVYLISDKYQRNELKKAFTVYLKKNFSKYYAVEFELIADRYGEMLREQSKSITEDAILGANRALKKKLWEQRNIF